MTKDRTAAARMARLRERQKAAGKWPLPSSTWLWPHEKAALDRLTSDGATVRDAVGAAIVLAAEHPLNR